MGLQGTIPGEVDVVTRDSKREVFGAKEFHLGNKISSAPSFGIKFYVLKLVVKDEYSLTTCDSSVSTSYVRVPGVGVTLIELLDDSSGMKSAPFF